MTPRLAGLALTALLLLTNSAHADDAETKAPSDDAGTIMSLQFKDAPIGTVIAEIARLSGRNIVVGPNVKGTTTVTLTKIPWKKALELIAAARGLKITHPSKGLTSITVDPNAKPLHAPGAKGQDRVLVTAVEGKTGLHRIDGHTVLLQGKPVTAKDTPIVSQVYDVRDLGAEHAGVAKAVREAEARGARVIRDDRGMLYVYAGPKDQARLSKALAWARATYVVVDGKGRAVRGVTLSTNGPLNADALLHPQMLKTSKRVENLRLALKHLQAAGATKEVRRVSVQLDLARAQLASMKAEIGAKRRALAAERVTVPRVWIPGRAGRPGGPGQPGTAGTAGAYVSLDSLRSEVRALRGDVRDLTKLVRELLAAQKRRR